MRIRHALSAVLALALVMCLALPSPVAAADDHRLTISGGEFSTQLYGVCDTTALQYAILAYVEGQSIYKGMNQNFPEPQGTITQSATADQFWHQYFALCDYYGLNLIRIGAGDSWGSRIQYEAWDDHYSAYISLLTTMARQAEAHGVWVCLVLGAAQEWPVYQYGGSGVVFETSSTAYSNYIAYCRSTMAALDDEDGIGMYDLMNEPDYDLVYDSYWSSNGGKSAFNTWSKAVASATAGYSTHPRTMGTAGQGNMFSFGQSDFDLATGSCGFEVLHRHYYASAQDEYLFADPESWAADLGKPLLWGELGNNGGGMYVRWAWAEQQIYAAGGQAITSMVLNPYPNYPYAGGSLIDQHPSTPGGTIDDVISGVVGETATWPYGLLMVGGGVTIVGVAYRRLSVLLVGGTAAALAILVLLARSGLA